MVQLQGAGHDLKAKDFGQESAEVNKSRAMAQKFGSWQKRQINWLKTIKTSHRIMHNHHRTKDLALGLSPSASSGWSESLVVVLDDRLSRPGCVYNSHSRPRGYRPL